MPFYRLLPLCHCSQVLKNQKSWGGHCGIQTKPLPVDVVAPALCGYWFWSQQLCFSHSTLPLACQSNGGGPRSLGIRIHMRNLKEAPGSWRLTGPAAGTVLIFQVNQQMERYLSLSFSLFCLSLSFVSLLSLCNSAFEVKINKPFKKELNSSQKQANNNKNSTIPDKYRQRW